MKEIIKMSGLSIKDFGEKYEIPYNTVRQWYNGERKAPEWVKKLIKKELEYKPLLHIEEEIDMYIYEYYNENGLRYRAHLSKEKTEEDIEWFNRLQTKYVHGEEGLCKRKIYKAYILNKL